MAKHWLDKYIKEQRPNRAVVKVLIGGKNNLQEMSEKNNWDSPRKRKR